jgi:hypothetical protein
LKVRSNAWGRLSLKRGAPAGSDASRARPQAHRRHALKLRVIIIRSKGENLGSIEAPDRERAEAVAIKQFDSDQDQRSRLLIGSGCNRAALWRGRS